MWQPVPAPMQLVFSRIDKYMNKGKSLTVPQIQKSSIASSISLSSFSVREKFCQLSTSSLSLLYSPKVLPFWHDGWDGGQTCTRQDLTIRPLKHFKETLAVRKHYTSNKKALKFTKGKENSSRIIKTFNFLKVSI